jgi:very-short-patch-repair endonuclease
MEPISHRDPESRGFSRGVLRGADWAHPVDGVSIPAVLSNDLEARCRAVNLVLADGAVFTHLTSAQLREWWLPPLAPIPLIACTDGEAPHHDRRGVYVRRCAIPSDHRTFRSGIPVASAAWTLIELAEHLTLVDLVVAIDCGLHLEHTTVDAIRTTMRPGRRGVRVLRRALELVDGRSESRWETILRLLHVLSGVDVEPQWIVRNQFDVIVARADLWIVDTSRLQEYDGGDHRVREQHQDDLRREKTLARLGYERYGYTAVELLRDPEQVIADADAALGRPADPSRVGIWKREAALSSLSSHGLAALGQRLRRFVRETTPRSSSGAIRVPSGADRHATPSQSNQSAPLAVQESRIWP